MEGLLPGGGGCASQQAAILPDDGTVIQPQEGSLAPPLLGRPDRSNLLLLPSRTKGAPRSVHSASCRAVPMSLCPSKLTHLRYIRKKPRTRIKSSWHVLNLRLVRTCLTRTVLRTPYGFILPVGFSSTSSGLGTDHT
jgi:hypothetical protein